MISGRLLTRLTRTVVKHLASQPLGWPEWRRRIPFRETATGSCSYSVADTDDPGTDLLPKLCNGPRTRTGP